MKKSSKLKMIIARLKLKELELLDRISKSHDDYIIRVITDPKTYEILAINGDWHKVSGFTEKECLGKSWMDFVAPEEREKIIRVSSGIQEDSKGFKESTFSFKKSSGGYVHSRAKSKYYEDIDATVSICKVIKLKPKKLKVKKRW